MVVDRSYLAGSRGEIVGCFEQANEILSSIK